MPVINATFIEAFTIDGGRVSETKGRDLNPILEPKYFLSFPNLPPLRRLPTADHEHHVSHLCYPPLSHSGCC